MEQDGDPPAGDPAGDGGGQQPAQQPPQPPPAADDAGQQEDQAPPPPAAAAPPVPAPPPHGIPAGAGVAWPDWLGVDCERCRKCRNPIDVYKPLFGKKAIRGLCNHCHSGERCKLGRNWMPTPGVLLERLKYAAERLADPRQPLDTDTRGVERTRGELAQGVRGVRGLRLARPLLDVFCHRACCCHAAEEAALGR